MSLRAACILLCTTASALAQTTHDTCVDVQVGTAQSYDCINQKLAAAAREAQKSSGTAATPPYGAQSPGNQTGQFNEAATRNRLGANFGKSVTPPQTANTYPGAFASPR